MYGDKWHQLYINQHIHSTADLYLFRYIKLHKTVSSKWLNGEREPTETFTKSSNNAA